MKNCIVLGAVAGIASGALGQEASLSIVASQTVVDSTVTTSITLAVYGDGSSNSYTHIQSAVFGLSAVGGAGVVEGMTLGSMASWSEEVFSEDFGSAGEGNYTGVNVSQGGLWIPFLPPDPASALGSDPVLLANFNVTIAAGSSGVIDWTLVGLPLPDSYAITLFQADWVNGGGSWGNFDNPDFGSVSVNVVPSPSGLTLLGLGGLVAGRRRR